jgi:hypothetical protein
VFGSFVSTAGYVAEAWVPESPMVLSVAVVLVPLLLQAVKTNAIAVKNPGKVLYMVMVV